MISTSASVRNIYDKKQLRSGFEVDCATESDRVHTQVQAAVKIESFLAVNSSKIIFHRIGFINNSTRLHWPPWFQFYQPTSSRPKNFGQLTLHRTSRV